MWHEVVASPRTRGSPASSFYRWYDLGKPRFFVFLKPAWLLLEINGGKWMSNFGIWERDKRTKRQFNMRNVPQKAYHSKYFGPVISNVDSHWGPSQSLIKSLLGEYDLSGLKAIQYGIHHEAEAVKSYEIVTGNRVKETGLWLHPSGQLWASPDEVKCSMKAKDNARGSHCRKWQLFSINGS